MGNMYARHADNENTFICEECGAMVPGRKRINMLYEEDNPWDFMTVCPPCRVRLARMAGINEMAEKLKRPGVVYPGWDPDDDTEDDADE